MSQPTGSRPSNMPLGQPESVETVSFWPTEGAVETFFSEPTDLRTRFADAGRPSAASALTYEPYFGLKEKPFSLSTDPRFLYKSGSHTPVFHELLGAIQRREGLVVLTGDIGTGKTTLCRAVLGQLDRKTFTTFVPDPFVSREDLLKMLLVEFGVVSVEDLRRGRLKGASRVELSYPLYEFLKSLGPLEAFAVLIIDEAQNLALPLLEEIRILSDLEDGRKLLQVVLVGQPEFRAHLKLPRMRQVDQRVSMRCELQPLTRDGVTNYVAHRLSMAGGASDRVAFAPSALDLAFDASGGIPRVINLICDRSLERGHRSAASIIEAGLVAGAIADLRLGPQVDLGAYEPLIAPFDELVSPPKEPVSPPMEAALAPLDMAARAEPVAAPAPSPRGLFEKQMVTTETPARASDLDVLLDLVPTPTRNGSALLARAAVPDVPTDAVAAAELEQTPASKPARDSRRGRRFGLAATIALAVIGTVTGVSLVGYVLWMGPLFTERPGLPPVQPPGTSQSSSVVGARTPSPVTSEKAAEPKEVEGGRWAVQVAAFASVARTSALIQQLSGEGFPAYEGRSGSGPESLRLVLVGPYGTSEEAESTRARIRQLPDLDGALLRDLETGSNF